MQYQDNFLRELVIDSFAGGGGASTGIELAIGRPVDIAINHDIRAILMHELNHPSTEHYCENVFSVDLRAAVRGRRTALFWLSPDCTHFSRAKGATPVKKEIRGLAWLAVKAAGTIRPRVIILENVEEFMTWGPIADGRPIKRLQGKTFHAFVENLRKLGYTVDYRVLRACDYGAPTIRKRFFLIARCDGQPIVWPEPTHGPGRKYPYRVAADIIDWSLECPSIFDRKKPLSENTLRRIARGIEKYVVNNADPFIVQVNHAGGFRGQEITTPLQTITGKLGFGIVTPVMMYNNANNTGGGVDEPLHTITTGNRSFLTTPVLLQVGYGDREGRRSLDLDRPLGTITAGGGKFALCSAFISKYFSGGYTGAGSSMNDPLPTVTAIDHNSVVTSHLIQFNNHMVGADPREPLNTITAGGFHIGEVRTFMQKYGNSVAAEKSKQGIITIHGVDYQIVDIGMRMLTPRELFLAQGFPEDYIIDRDKYGHPYPKSAQIARCGNSVPPPFATALVRANLPELAVKRSISTMAELDRCVCS